MIFQAAISNYLSTVSVILLQLVSCIPLHYHICEDVRKFVKLIYFPSIIFVQFSCFVSGQTKAWTAMTIHKNAISTPTTRISKVSIHIIFLTDRNIFPFQTHSLFLVLSTHNG